MDICTRQFGSFLEINLVAVWGKHGNCFGDTLVIPQQTYTGSNIGYDITMATAQWQSGNCTR